MIAMDTSSEDRDFRVGMEGWLRDAARGCRDAVDSQWGDTPGCWVLQYRVDCKLCANRMKNTGPGKYTKGGRLARGQWSGVYQLEAGICGDCGEIHNNGSDFITYDYCKPCSMKRSVQALYRHRGIFGSDDDEAILDRMFISHKELFEAGVLPDYWYELQGKVKA